MELSKSAKLYLENYFVLDVARSEAHNYLETIITKAVDQVDEHLKKQDNLDITFDKYIQKDGGHAGFVFERKTPMQGLESIDKWKFYMLYRDAMRTTMLSSSSKCKVYCEIPKSHTKLETELKRMSTELSLPDLIRVEEIDLTDKPQEDVISAIKNQFIDFYDQFIKLVTALIEEAHES